MPLLIWIAGSSIVVSVACAGFIVLDEGRHPQTMAIMNVVWPITALYAGPIGLWAYFRFGREGEQKPQPSRDDKRQPSAASVAKGTTHCGAGCTLGDVIAETLLIFFPGIAVALGWRSLWQEKIFSTWMLDFILAFVIGIAFQYLSIKPMHPKISPGNAMARALKADALSLAAWQVGMYAVMTLAHFVVFPHLVGQPLAPAGLAFWWVMQFAMMAGFLTAYPVNRWLISRGVKDAM